VISHDVDPPGSAGEPVIVKPNKVLSLFTNNTAEYVATNVTVPGPGESTWSIGEVVHIATLVHPEKVIAGYASAAEVVPCHIIVR